jgi:hypothetical protein
VRRLVERRPACRLAHDRAERPGRALVRRELRGGDFPHVTLGHGVAEGARGSLRGCVERGVRPGPGPGARAASEGSEQRRAGPDARRVVSEERDLAAGEIDLEALADAEREERLLPREDGPHPFVTEPLEARAGRVHEAGEEAHAAVLEAEPGAALYLVDRHLEGGAERLAGLGKERQQGPALGGRHGPVDGLVVAEQLLDVDVCHAVAGASRPRRDPHERTTPLERCEVLIEQGRQLVEDFLPRQGPLLLLVAHRRDLYPLFGSPPTPRVR